MRLRRYSLVTQRMRMRRGLVAVEYVACTAVVLMLGMLVLVLLSQYISNRIELTGSIMGWTFL